MTLNNFSRAVKPGNRLGLQRLLERTLSSKYFARTEKAQGLKPGSLLGLYGPTKVVP